VITEEVDAYIHAGGQHEWDSAAPVAVALVAGLHVSRIDASELTYNQLIPALPDLVVCRPGLGEGLLAHVAGRPLVCVAGIVVTAPSAVHAFMPQHMRGILSFDADWPRSRPTEVETDPVCNRRGNVITEVIPDLVGRSSWPTS
jgi:hypothetical protein